MYYLCIVVLETIERSLTFNSKNYQLTLNLNVMFTKNVVSLFCLISILLIIASVDKVQAGGGGTCTMSDACSGATSLVENTVYSMDNSACSVKCSQKFCTDPNSEDCWVNVSDHLLMGLLSCASMENSQWGKYCPTSSGSYDFKWSATAGCVDGIQTSVFTGVDCSDASKATSLYENCSATTGGATKTLSLTAGTCYWVVTDGFAGAKCTFTFEIAAAVLPITLKDYFVAKTDYTGVTLRWVTENEVNNKEFVINRKVIPNISSEIVGNNIGPIQDGEYQSEEIATVPASGLASATYEYTDKDIIQSGTYYYELIQVDVGGMKRNAGVIETFIAPPDNFEVTRVYPNPFSSDISIVYTLDQTATVKFRVYDILGKKVYTDSESQKAGGIYVKVLNLRNLRSGMYFYSVESNGKTQSGKFLKM